MKRAGHQRPARLRTRLRAPDQAAFGARQRWAVSTSSSGKTRETAALWREIGARTAPPRERQERQERRQRQERQERQINEAEIKALN